MPDLTIYTGAAPNDFARRVFDALEANGFSIASTPRSPVESKSRTLCVSYRGIYVGQMRSNLWGARQPIAILHRFPDASRISVAHAPKDFDTNTFAIEHGVDPAMLFLRFDRGENKSYLYVRDIGAAVKLMQDWARLIDHDLLPQVDGTDEVNLESDLREILTDPKKSDARKRVEIDARLGQGKFRSDLLREFRYACAVTQLSLTPALRASHIVPWREADDDEKVNAKNGLLLSANVDALFDRYLITFEPNGNVRKSILLTDHDCAKLGPLNRLSDAPCDERAAFLRRHNTTFDNLERRRIEYVNRSTT